VNEQLDMLIEQAQSVFDLPSPTMSYGDCTLNYRQYQQEVRHGLCSFDDDDEKPQFTTVTECSLPTSANIVETYEQYGQKRERNFTIYGSTGHTGSSGEVINYWLEHHDYRTKCLGKESPAGKWILAHAAEMNAARRIWDARRKSTDIYRLKEELALLQERIRIEELNLGVKVAEAAENRNFTTEEKQIKLKELGALDKDLTP
jgi:hypothetical protein